MKTYKKFIKESQSGLGLVFAALTISAVTSSVRQIMIKYKHHKFNKEIEKELNDLKKEYGKLDKQIKSEKQSRSISEGVKDKFTDYVLKKYKELKKHISKPENQIEIVRVTALIIMLQIFARIDKKQQITDWSKSEYKAEADKIGKALNIT